ncbi:MAG: DUF4065 domain-containing protein [Candidatus Sumerlaeota bacterium]|nr:DUF4065 domain-containing protein [Candidatus Sumerlaeota bacterium]
MAKEQNLISAHDVAAYILRACGEMTAMKLQKLLYYCQAWSLVWDERPLFKEDIEAWTNGPVVREVYEKHKGQFLVSDWPLGNPDVLNDEQRETIKAVLDGYGSKPSQWLSDLTHMERPWKDAREGLSDDDRGHRVISHAAMGEYYSSLPPDSSAL